MTRHTTRDRRAYRPANPFEMGAVSGAKHYASILISTDRGRWSVLLFALVSIITFQLDPVIYPAVASASAATVTFYARLTFVVLGAMLFNVLLDALHHVRDENRGGED